MFLPAPADRSPAAGAAAAGAAAGCFGPGGRGCTGGGFPGNVPFGPIAGLGPVYGFGCGGGDSTIVLEGLGPPLPGLPPGGFGAGGGDSTIVFEGLGPPPPGLPGPALIGVRERLPGAFGSSQAERGARPPPP